MTISSYNSQKIKVLNLVLIVMVLYIHSYYLEAEDGYTIAQAVQMFVGSTGLCAPATRLFYVISGFLFFGAVTTVACCYPKMKKRIRSLLIPYVLWNVIFVGWYVLLEYTPGVGSYVNGDIIEKIGSGSLVSGLAIVFWEPANFPLWFLRDLILMVAVSPLLYYFIKYLKWWAPLLLALTLPFVDLHISPFFLLGGCIAMHSSLEEVNQKLWGGYVCLAAIVYLGYSVADIFGVPESIWQQYLFLLANLCGVIVIWKGYDSIMTKKVGGFLIDKVTPLLGYSFFIYLFHEPAFNIIKKLGLKVLGVHEWSLILLYLINPLIMCAMAIAVAKVLQRLLPKTYSILVGGR